MGGVVCSDSVIMDELLLVKTLWIPTWPTSTNLLFRVYHTVCCAYLTLTHVTFDLNPIPLMSRSRVKHSVKSSKSTFFYIELWPMTFTCVFYMIYGHYHTKFGEAKSNGSRDINFFLVNFSPVTSRWTDRPTETTPKSISTDGLNMTIGIALSIIF